LFIGLCRNQKAGGDGEAVSKDSKLDTSLPTFTPLHRTVSHNSASHNSASHNSDSHNSASHNSASHSHGASRGSDSHSEGAASDARIRNCAGMSSRPVQCIIVLLILVMTMWLVQLSFCDLFLINRLFFILFT